MSAADRMRMSVLLSACSLRVARISISSESITSTDVELSVVSVESAAAEGAVICSSSSSSCCLKIKQQEQQRESVKQGTRGELGSRKG